MGYLDKRPCPRCGDKGEGEIKQCKDCGAIYCITCSDISSYCPNCKSHKYKAIGIKSGGLYDPS